MKDKIIVCDDDEKIVESVSIFLEQEGYDVIKAYDGLETLKLARKSEPSLFILDIMMPGMDGLTLTREIRTFSNAPILMVTAKSEDSDKIIGLNFGADDYLTKPYNPLELVARAKALIRRFTRLGAQTNTQNILSTGGLELDLSLNEVRVDGEAVAITATEFGILKLLMTHKGRVFSINEIYEKVWNEAAYAPENTVAVHIRRIREKIEIDPKNPKYLKVVWGIGYKIEKMEA